MCSKSLRGVASESLREELMAEVSVTTDLRLKDIHET